MLVKLNGEFFTKSRDEIDLWWFIFHLGHLCATTHYFLVHLGAPKTKIILPFNKAENF